MILAMSKIVKLKISIIIPILNETTSIGKLLSYLTQSVYIKENIAQILIVDGGSTDGSQELVTTFSDDNQDISITLISSEKGRAKQMNKGAAHATSEILYFLHADSFPPKHFDDYIINEVQKSNLAGCFCMKFDHNHWWLKLAGWFTKFSSRICRGGDQSQFITAALFKTLGGYNESFIIYEDNDLISKLYARKEFVVIQQWLTTSARRYKTYGIWKLQYHFWIIHLKSFFGASPEDLYQYYKKNITS